jgi:hypothetical protein
MAHLEIDKDPTNGGGPCMSIDTDRSIAQFDTFTVALCLSDAASSPIGGEAGNIQLQVVYNGAVLNAPDVIDDALTDLDGNPDWNDGDLPGWDCNVINDAAAAPSGTPGPAVIACVSPFGGDDSPLPGLASIPLATLTLDAVTGGVASLTWGPGQTEILTMNETFACGVNFTCIDDPILIVGCPVVPSPWFWSNGPGIPGEDGTVPSSPSGGEPCDGDNDNDGRSNVDELDAIGCGGVVTLVNIDNAAGLAGGPTSWDTDGDVVPDGVECAEGTDPTVALAAHRTACADFAPGTDADGDGLEDNWEKCKWNSSPAMTNTDGDAIGDCREAMDVNGNGSLTNGDATLVVQAFFDVLAGPPLGADGDLAVLDINGNGSLTNGDATLVRQRFFNSPACVP